jgi:DNA ligase-1
MEHLIKTQFGDTIRNMIRRGDGTISKEDGAKLKRDIERAAGLTDGTLNVPGNHRTLFLTSVGALASSPSKKTMYIMIGPSGAGKTTYSERLARDTGAVLISSDNYGSARKRIDKAVNDVLARGKNVIVDATHPTRERRAELKNIAKKHGVSTRCIRLDVSKNTALSRSKLEGAAKYITSSKFSKSYEDPGSECDRVNVISNGGHSMSVTVPKQTTSLGKRPLLPNAIPKAMLAHKYDAKKHSGKKFYASEKLDGIRAMFLDGVLYTRGGNPVRAPAWFLEKIPDGTFDGELFGGRGRFQETSSIVMGPSTNPLWKTVTYKIFDDWKSTDPFSKTYDKLTRKLPLCSSSSSATVCLEPHTEVSNNRSVQSFYDDVVRQGGEGLMLRSNVPYKPGTRSNAILKVKKMQDAEAKVVGFDMDSAGAIKSLVCKWINPGFDRAVTFKVGSGLSGSERDPRAFTLGDVITVQYFELTKSGKPRFPVFKGIRRNL